MSVYDHIPVMEIEGNYYKYKRLGQKAIPELMQLAAMFLTDGFERLQIRVKFLKELAGGFSLNEKGELDAQQLQQYMGLLTIAFGTGELLSRFHGFCSRNLRKTNADGTERGALVTIEELEDDELFPAYTLVQLVVWMTFHPDFELLKAAVVEGVKIPFFQQALDDVSGLAQEGLSEAFKQTSPSETQTNDNTPS